MQISSKQDDVLRMTASIAQAFSSSQVSLLNINRFLVANDWEPSDDVIRRLRVMQEVAEDLKLDSNLLEASVMAEIRRQHNH